MPTAAVCTKEVVHDKGKFGSTCGRDCHKCDEAGASVFVTAKNTSLCRPVGRHNERGGETLETGSETGCQGLISQSQWGLTL